MVLLLSLLSLHILKIVVLVFNSIHFMVFFNFACFREQVPVCGLNVLKIFVRPFLNEILFRFNYCLNC